MKTLIVSSTFDLPIVLTAGFPISTASTNWGF